MNLGWVKPLIFKSKKWMVKNAPHLLMAMGTGGSITALIFAIKATPNASDARTEAIVAKTANKQNLDIHDATIGILANSVTAEKLTIPETFKACGKYYIPAIGIELFSLMCFWSAHGIDVKRQAVLAGLYSTAEQALIEYQKKVVEMIGEKPEKEIRNAVAQDVIDQTPPPATNNYYFTNDDEKWFIIRGQRFRSTYGQIKDAMNQANWEMIQHMYISETELFWLLDPDHKWLKPTDDSGHVGWNVDRLLVLDIHWGEDPGHNPVGVIDYYDKDGRRYDPSPGFSHMM